MKIQNEKERFGLSKNFSIMANSLIEEGNNLKCMPILQAGAIFMILSDIILHDEDMDEMHNYCAMISAKKILHSMKNFDNGIMLNQMLKTMLEAEDAEADKKIRESFKRVEAKLTGGKKTAGKPKAPAKPKAKAPAKKKPTRKKNKPGDESNTSEPT